MRVVITGATGLIGGALRASLRDDGHTVHVVTRSAAKAGPDDVVWDVDAGRLDPAPLEGVDAAVHLAGELIGQGRGQAVRRRIHHSRVAGTRLLAETLAGLHTPPKVLVSASAVGWYGNRGDEILTEDSGPGDDFIARVCRDWEAAADPARHAGLRVVHPRTGVVLSREGPLLKKVDLPFRLGVGGRVGSGRQYIPWVSLSDHVRAIRFLIEREDLAGPVNLTAPSPVTNAEFTRALGKVLRRPTVLPIPLFAVELVYGDTARLLAAASQRAVPRRLQEAGFGFVDSDLGAALRVALGRDAAA